MTLSEMLLNKSENAMYMEFKKFVESAMLNHTRFIIWGNGYTGRTALSMIKDLSGDLIKPEYIVDNNSSMCDGTLVRSSEDFKREIDSIDTVLVCVYTANQVLNQLDAMGYKGNTLVVSSSVMKTDENLIEFYESNMEEIENTFNLLEDEKSKKTIATFINVMRTGNILLWDDVNLDDKYKMLGASFLDIQDNEHYIDIGAFTGDTLSMFLELSNNGYSSIICVEPDVNNYNLLCENVKNKGLNNTYLYNNAVGARSELIRFSNGKSESCYVSENGETTIKMIAIDDIDKAKDATLIKISTNGFDLNVLKGAEQTIIKNKPKIATYASGTQLWEIPKYLKKICPEYKIYYRHFGVGNQAMICYAV